MKSVMASQLFKQSSSLETMVSGVRTRPIEVASSVRCCMNAGHLEMVCSGVSSQSSLQ